MQDGYRLYEVNFYREEVEQDGNVINLTIDWRLDVGRDVQEIVTKYEPLRARMEKSFRGSGELHKDKKVGFAISEAHVEGFKISIEPLEQKISQGK